MKCAQVMATMERLAPKKLAGQWDNPGLLLGSPDDKITRILVALDVRESVVDAADDGGFDMIVSHHPMIFNAIKKIRTDSADGRIIAKLLKSGIAVFAAHTNLDAASGGVNDVLSEKIGLHDTELFHTSEKDEDECFGRIGYLPEARELDEFAADVKSALGAKWLRIVRGGAHPVKKVGVVSGSGAEFVARAAFFGCDTFLTGDVRYHDAERAVKLGIHLVDAGHFATEQPVVEALAAKLSAELGDEVEVQGFTGAEDFFEAV